MNLSPPLSLQTPAPRPIRDLDSMDIERVGRGIIAFQPTLESIGPLLERARVEIPGIATLETILRVYAHNPDCLFALARANGTLEPMREPAGFIAQLPLNAAGLAALIDGSLDTADPDTACVCQQHEKPSAIYIWAIFVNHRISGGIAHVMERLSSAKNRTAPLYCKATSPKSWSFFLTLGFSPGVIHDGRLISELMEYRRNLHPEDDMAVQAPAASRRRAPYDTVDDPSRVLPEANQIGITVVHGFEDLVRVFAIRAATYIAEQDCPYAEEYDGNDFSGTHLLGFIGSEPAGCLRIRQFADFAKLERLAVLPRFRQSRLALQLITAGIAFCRTKGYRRLYGHAEPRVLKLWEHFGFRPRTADPTFSFSDRDFMEGDLELPAFPDALTTMSDPYVLIRPEGQWDRPGVLDKSARGKR